MELSVVLATSFSARELTSGGGFVGEGMGARES